MRRLFINIDCDEKECGSCSEQEWSEPPALLFLRCNLFNRVLIHRHTKAGEGGEKGEAVGIRCPTCRKLDAGES